LAVLIGALAGAPAAAADCPRTSLGDIENEVMCPVCGTPLNLAEEAPQAQRERAFIERLVARCRSKDQIKQALVAQFGEQVLALPGDEGDDDLGDVVVYVVPALAVLLAAGAVAVGASRWRRRKRPAGAAPAASTRLDEDIDRYDL
jgi:cytochrome c-type biogenesis protein CcmH/NrfF